MSKTKKQKSLVVRVVIVIVAGICVLAACLVAWQYATNDTMVVTERGVVQEKDESCTRELLQSDGSYTSGKGVCDGGNYMKLNGVSISIGGGSMKLEPQQIADITDVHPGDTVEVRYIKQDGQGSTDCSTCYAKILKKNSHPAES